MKVLLIPDKFKGSLTAKEVVTALTKGIRSIHGDAKITALLASDGGDGFLDAVSENQSCTEVFLDTVDPLGRKIKAYYLLDKKGQKAYIELAKASGLELLTDDERSALNTSTLGTGIQIKDAIKKGATEIYIGLGGSATNDAGIGIAHAFGYRFLDKDGAVLKPIGKNLAHIEDLKTSGSISGLEKVSFFAVNDVNNVLFGARGAAYTYAEQKGANLQEIERLDFGLKHLSMVVDRILKKDVANVSGAGAAGGAAYGLNVFFDATFISGIDFILGLSGAEDLLKNEKFDFIITGEGKFDDQTLHGKLIKGVVDLGQCHDTPVLVVCGKNEVDANRLKGLGVEDVLEISDRTKPLLYNMKNAAELVEGAISRFFEKNEIGI